MEKDAVRVGPTASQEEIDNKDLPLDQLLNKISGAISAKPVNILPKDMPAHAPAPAPSTQRQPSIASWFDATPPGTSGGGAASQQQQQQPARQQLARRRLPARGRAAQDDAPGRIPVQVLMDVLAANDRARDAGLRGPDLSALQQRFKLDPKVIEAVLKHYALPRIREDRRVGLLPRWFTKPLAEEGDAPASSSGAAAATPPPRQPETAASTSAPPQSDAEPAAPKMPSWAVSPGWSAVQADTMSGGGGAAVVPGDSAAGGRDARSSSSSERQTPDR